MSDEGSAGTTGGQLGERRLGTIHAVAQALAIGPMFSTAIVLGFVSAPVTGAGFNTALSVLVAGLGVLAIAYAISVFARQYQGAGAVYEYLVRGAHPAVGILTAGVFFMGTLFLGGGGIYLGLGILTNGFWTEHISKSTVPSVVVPRAALHGAGAGAELHRRADRDRSDAHVRRTLVHPDADPRARDHLPGQQHVRRLQSLNHVGAHRLQRRDARHPAVRRLRGGRVTRRGEPRPGQVDPTGTDRHRGRLGAVLRDHVVRDLDRPRARRRSRRAPGSTRPRSTSWPPSTSAHGSRRSSTWS